MNALIKINSKGHQRKNDVRPAAVMVTGTEMHWWPAYSTAFESAGQDLSLCPCLADCGTGGTELGSCRQPWNCLSIYDMTDIHRQNAGATRRNNAWLKRQARCHNCKKFGTARLQPASQNSRQSTQLCSGANWNGTSHGLDPSRPWPKASAKTSQRCRCNTCRGATPSTNNAFA